MKFRLPEFVLGALLAFAIASIWITLSVLPGAQMEGTFWPWLTKDASGFFGFAQTTVAGLQAILFMIQFYFIKASLDVANRSALAAEHAVRLERPWLFVYGPDVVKDAVTDEFWVEYTVANHGTRPAIIETPLIGFEMSHSGSPSMPKLAADNNNLRINPIIPPGDRRRIKEYFPKHVLGDGVAHRVFQRSPASHPLMEQIPLINEEAGLLYFIVVINYRGPVSVGHRTRICWLYDEGEASFAIHGGEILNDHS